MNNKLTINTILKELKTISIAFTLLLLFAVISSNKLTKTVQAETTLPKNKVIEQILFCESVKLQSNGFYTLNLLNPTTGEGYIIENYYTENKEQIDQCYFIAIIDTRNDDILDNNEILELYNLDEYGANSDNIDYNITKDNSIIEEQVLTCKAITKQLNGKYALQLENKSTRDVYNYFDYEFSNKIEKENIISKQFVCIINNNCTKEIEDNYIIEIYNLKEYSFN